MTNTNTKTKDDALEEAKSDQRHIPVLASEVLAVLAPKKGERYLDLTAGYGGHAALVITGIASQSLATLVDRDASASNALAAKFPEARIIHQDFLGASQKLAETGEKFDLILADLGVSSEHLNNAYRGFSFSASSPLDMRMDNTQELTAAKVVNSYSEDKLAEIISRYGEEPKARQLAKLIVQNRPLATTTELAALAKRVWPGRSRVHPATRLFQAIRMEVNDELGQLERTLPQTLELLAPGGRLAVISFHSLEDGKVKRFMAEHANGYDAELELLTKKPITASNTEIAFNPRSRSAKLRAAAKINRKGKLSNAYPGKK